MKKNNTLKYIRNLYGATQDEVANIVGVTRATISNWENNNGSIPPIALEKLSLFFGIAPEYFYDTNISTNEGVKLNITNTSKTQRELESLGKNRVDDFKKVFEDKSFKSHILSYMTTTKILLSCADSATLEELQLIKEINTKLGKRIDMFMKIKEEEKLSFEDIYNKLK